MSRRKNVRDQWQAVEKKIWLSALQKALGAFQGVPLVVIPPMRLWWMREFAQAAPDLHWFVSHAPEDREIAFRLVAHTDENLAALMASEKALMAKREE